MTTPSSPKLTLVSSDDQQFEVDVTAAVKSLQLKRMIEDDCAGEQIPLPNVSGNILAKIIEYCDKHAAHEATKANDRDIAHETADNAKLKKWDAEFVDVDMDTLFDLIMAANYMEIKSLLDLTCKTVADKIRGKTPEELRKLFNIKNDFSPEEEEEIRSENQWAFE